MPQEELQAQRLPRHGHNAQRHRDDPEGFDKVYHQRSLVETAFSVIKERFGAVARARTLVMRKLRLAPRCVCHDLVA